MISYWFAFYFSDIIVVCTVSICKFRGSITRNATLTNFLLTSTKITENVHVCLTLIWPVVLVCTSIVKVIKNTVFKSFSNATAQWKNPPYFRYFQTSNYSFHFLQWKIANFNLLKVVISYIDHTKKLYLYNITTVSQGLRSGGGGGGEGGTCVVLFLKP